MPKFFICYRREESAFAAQMFYEKLIDKYDTDSVVLDVDSIPLGVDYREYLDEQVGQCDVLLALIGRRWLRTLEERLPEEGLAKVRDLAARIPECLIVEDISPYPYPDRVERLRRLATGAWLCILSQGTIPLGDALDTLLREATKTEAALALPRGSENDCRNSSRN